MGYNLFTVIHQYSFKKVYVNVETKEEVSVHTNRIEKSWKHAKDNFRRMVERKLGQFEGHIAEMMWRCDTRDDLFFKFFELLRSVYQLDTPPVYQYTTPRFDTWRPGSSTGDPPVTWEIMPVLYIANTDAESCSDREVAAPAGGSQKPVVISSDSGPNRNPTAFQQNKPLHFKPQGPHGNFSLERSLLGKLKLGHRQCPERVCRHQPGFKEKNMVSESDDTDNPEPMIPASASPSRRRNPRKHLGKGN